MNQPKVLWLGVGGLDIQKMSQRASEDRYSEGRAGWDGRRAEGSSGENLRRLLEWEVLDRRMGL